MKNIFLFISKILHENEEKAVIPEKQPTVEDKEITEIKLKAQKIKALAQLLRAKNEFKRAKVDQSSAQKEEDDHAQNLTATYPNQQQGKSKQSAPPPVNPQAAPPPVSPNEDPNQQLPEDQQVPPQEEIEPQVKDANLNSGNPLNEPVAKEDILVPLDDDIEKINEDGDDEIKDEKKPLWNKYHPDPNNSEQMEEYRKSLKPPVDPNQPETPLDPSQVPDQQISPEPPNEPQGQIGVNEPPHETAPVYQDQQVPPQEDSNQQLPKDLSDQPSQQQSSLNPDEQLPEDQQVPPQEETQDPQTKLEADIAKKQAEVKKIQAQTQDLQNKSQMGSEDSAMGGMGGAAGMGGPMDSSMMGMAPQKPDPLKGFGDKTSAMGGMMGGMMGGIDPMTGMPSTDNSASVNSSAIGRIYELKKIYYRLMQLNKMLTNCPDKEMNEIQKVTSESFDLLRLIIQNLKTYKDKIDDIIISYFSLVKDISSKLEQHYMKKSQSEED